MTVSLGYWCCDAPLLSLALATDIGYTRMTLLGAELDAPFV